MSYVGRLAVFAIGAAGVGAVALGARRGLRRQAAIARRRIGKPLGEDAVDADRVWRPKLPGPPVELVLLGDSLAAGLGASRPKQTLGGRLAKGLARAITHPVRLRTAAVVGAESSDLSVQLSSLPAGYRPDVAVIVVGGNDVTHRVPPATSAAHLRAAVDALRDRGAAVVVGTCPDLGALRPVPQPLRRLAGTLSRVLAGAQRRAALRAGAVPVDLRRAVGRRFRSDPDEMFSIDRFHPSAAGYRQTTAALLPAVVVALRSRAGDQAGVATRSGWWMAATSGCARRRDFRAFSP
ncbi:SGNH/GDSL hydrolase family protein [Microbacterium gorillae]|uniref:SGNH/GDSL hydrolase family protein n=1 Tax=Microbacterium gorillae TaxID=1231063 RepID=UPI000B9B412F|nr:SGNH/GDSL hydrolase family protein [Microbacterium gorillae]